MAAESQQNISKDDEISLKDLILKIREWWRYLLSKWFVILIFSLFGGTLGFVYSYLKKSIYTATTTFVLEDEKSGGSGLNSLAGLASIAGVDLGSGGGGIFEGDNILELYRSRKMIEKTLLTSVDYKKGKKILLIEYYIQFNKLRDKWNERPELKSLSFASYTYDDTTKTSVTSSMIRLRDSVMGSVYLDILKNYLIVSKLDKKLSIIKAEVKSKDEFFSKAFNDEIVKNVNDFYLKTKTKKALENVKILQMKVDSVRAVMNGAIYTAAAVADATPNLNVSRSTQRIAPIQRSQFTAETNKAILSSLVQNLEMSKIALRQNAPLIQVVDQPIYPLEKSSASKVVSFAIGFMLLFFLSSAFILISNTINSLLLPKVYV